VPGACPAGGVSPGWRSAQASASARNVAGDAGAPSASARALGRGCQACHAICRHNAATNTNSTGLGTVPIERSAPGFIP